MQIQHDSYETPTRNPYNLDESQDASILWPRTMVQEERGRFELPWSLHVR